MAPLCIKPRIVGWVPVAPRRSRLTLPGISVASVIWTVTVTGDEVLTVIILGVAIGVPTVGVVVAAAVVTAVDVLLETTWLSGEVPASAGAWVVGASAAGCGACCA